MEDRLTCYHQESWHWALRRSHKCFPLGGGRVFSQEVCTVSLEVLFLTPKTSQPFPPNHPCLKAAVGAACGHGGPAKEP